jgi:amino acid transporter
MSSPSSATLVAMRVLFSLAFGRFKYGPYTSTIDPHMVGEKLFLRKASGVVRNVGPLDVFFYNIGLINIGIGISYILLLGPAFYPGVDILLGISLVTIGCLFQAFTYYFFSVNMPRSGGDYVYISRSLGPLLGFVMSWNMVIWLLFYSAWSSGAIGWLGLSSFLQAMAQFTGDKVLADAAIFVSRNEGWFVIGTISLIISTIILIAGTRVYFKINNAFMYLALLGSFITLFVLASASREQFMVSFQKFTGLGYDEVIRKASEAGWSAASPSSMTSFLGFMIWPFYPLAYSFMSCAFAGEIKKVEKSQLYGVPGSLAFVAIILIATTVAAYKTIGYEFLGAISFNYYNNPDFSTRIIPWIGYLSSMLTDNLLLTLLINLSFVAWSWFWIPGCIIYASRVMLAWSMDRLMPEVVGYVSPKYNTPVISTIIAFLIAEIFLALFAFTAWFTTLVGIASMVITFVLIGISGIVFPYRARSIYEKSPVKYNIGALPLMPLLGLGTALFMAIMLYPFFTDQVGGAWTELSRTAIAIVFIIGIGVYIIAKEYRKRRGVDISLAFKEIPVE